MKLQDKNFFCRSPEEVAKDLLGKKIACLRDGKTEYYQIAETEAYYHDERDAKGKLICYGAGKTKAEAKKLVTAALFERPGTWCIYDGQLLLSVLDEQHPDNVLIKVLRTEENKSLGPDGIANALHLYISKADYCDCHGKHSLECPQMYLTGDDISVGFCADRRINIDSTNNYRFIWE